WPMVSVAQPSVTLHDRIEGLLIGAFIGDAAGGPVEFQAPQRGPWTATDTVLTPEGIAALASAFHLRAYPMGAGSYAHWTDYGPPGTVTDDSRFKLLFIKSLREAGRADRDAFAREILRFHADTTGRYPQLRQDWLDEFAYAARWVLGERDEAIALPPERQWGGIATMAGQMPFLPIAALHPGDPDAAYRTVWDVDFLDNGIGRDINAGLVAGLATALADGATWADVDAAMRTTDPYGFTQIEWVPRRSSRWLDVARNAVREAEGRPKRLFDILVRDLQATTWWDAWIPTAVTFACAEMTGHDPLATLQLILEFGYDTDSYMQVAGALFGALHGPAIFPEAMRQTVIDRLEADYDVRFADLVALLHQHAAP
ncbi:MAG: ADP-ribosylglycohydrolase family protein, partial [Bacteroidota bacterium]